MSLIVQINPVPWKILELVKARILKNRAKKAKKGMDWSDVKRQMSLQPGPLSRRRKDEPSFVFGGLHYSISILDGNVDYFKGKVTGGARLPSGVLVNETVYWISKSPPTLVPLAGIISNYPEYTAVKLQDFGGGAGVPGYFYTQSGGVPISFQPDTGGFIPETPALWMRSPVVTTTGKYSALLDRDWQAWSEKTLFEYESENNLGNVSNSNGKRFILIVPQKKDTPGIQAYPEQWPNLAGEANSPVGVTIKVARQAQAESMIAGSSDYFSLIEAATGLPWGDVDSVFISEGTNASYSDLQKFKEKLTELSIPFASTTMGSVLEDAESWVYSHSLNP